MRGRSRGMIWGIAVGLFLDSLMLVTTTAWLLFAIWPLLIPVMIGAVAGGLLGHAAPISVSLRTTIMRFSAVIVLWSACIALPIVVRWTQLLLEVRSLPISAGCERGSLEITVLAFDDTPGYRVVLDCNADPSEIIDFYRKELPRLGWSAPVAHQYGNHISYDFAKTRRRLRICEVSKEDYVVDSGQLMRFRQVSIECVAANFSYH